MLCLLGCKKSCIHLVKGICQVVYKVLILDLENQRLKKNLKRLAWGLDVGQEDRTRIQQASTTLILSMFLEPKR